MKHSWLRVLVVLVVVAGGALYIGKSLTNRSVLPSVQAAPEKTSPRVSALGRIRPLGEIIDVGADPTRRVAQILVVEGQAVGKGDILAYLDNYDEMQAAANHAESQYAGGQAQLAARTAIEEVNIAKAEIDLKGVETLNPKGITVQELTIEKLTAELSLAQIEVDRYEQSFKERSSSREALDKKKTEFAARKSEFESATADLAKMKESLDLDIARAKQSVAAARANLKLVEANLDLNTVSKNVELAKARLAATILRAPVDGQILKLRTRLGEVVRSQTVLTMADLATMAVVAEVYETDVLRIEEGQKATITATALATPLTGTVVYVGRVINKQSVSSLDPAAPADARTAEVRVRLDDPQVAARLINLQVTATIELKK